MKTLEYIVGNHPCREVIRCDECEFYYGSCLHVEGRRDDIKGFDDIIEENKDILQRLKND